ncbi:MAG: helix-turn-helix transcriptional regulator [Acidimicrobiales bacterium]
MSASLDAAVRLRRLLAVLTVLAQEGEVLLDDLAGRFGMRPAELVADLELAACCGLPPYTPDQLMEIVVTETTVTAHLGRDLARPRRLSPAEGFALQAAARAVLAVPGSDPEGALARALAVLDDALGRVALDVDLDAPEHLATVQEAASSERAVAVIYYSASSDQTSERVLVPLRVFAAEGHWYTDALAGADGDVRRFRVDRITAARLVARPAWATGSGPATATSTAVDAAASLFVPGPDSRRVRLAVDRTAAWLLEPVALPGSVTDDGDRVVCTVAVGGDAFLERLLLQLGPAAEVLEPAEDRAVAAAAAARVLDRYRRNDDRRCTEP